MAAIAGFSVTINPLLWSILDGSHSRFIFLVQLLCDLLTLSALLYITGGATNPFAWLLLLPLAIAATVLSKPHTWLATIAVCLLYSVLMQFYEPIPNMHMPNGSGFALHILGMWIGFIVSALVIAHFLSSMAANVRARDRTLAQARELALRDEKLISLGTLAANLS